MHDQSAGNGATKDRRHVLISLCQKSTRGGEGVSKRRRRLELECHLRKRKAAATEAGVVPKRRAAVLHNVDLWWWHTPLSVDVLIVASIHHPIPPAYLGGNRPVGDTCGLKGAPCQQQSRSRVLFHPSTACILSSAPSARNQALSPGCRI